MKKTLKRQKSKSRYSFMISLSLSHSITDLDSMFTFTSRMDKRYLDKKNKAARTKRKTDDNARLRKLIDQASDLDPRLKQFKEQDRMEKDKKKNEKRLAEERSVREAQLKAEEEKRMKEEKERLEKEKAVEDKKQREALKSLLRRERKTVKALFKDRQYFMDTKDLKAFEARILMVDAVIEKLSMLQLVEFKNNMEAMINAQKQDDIVTMLEQAASCIFPRHPSSP